MRIVSQLIGWILLSLAVVAIGFYIYHGNWKAVALVVALSIFGRMILGAAEVIAIPFALPTISFAKRGSVFASTMFSLLSNLVTKIGFCAFCIFVLLYILRESGPPAWIAVLLAWTVAGAPFYWGKMNEKIGSAKNIDYIAANLGVPATGLLLLAGFPLLVAIIPIAVLFVASAVVSTVWWVNSGLAKVRAEHLLQGIR